MAHTIRNKKKMMARLHRLQGQLASVERALGGGDEDCYKVLLTLSSCRGALNGLMGEVVEGHIREHVVGAKSARDAAAAGEETLEILKSFWK